MKNSLSRGTLEYVLCVVPSIFVEEVISGTDDSIFTSNLSAEQILENHEIFVVTVTSVEVYFIPRIFIRLDSIFYPTQIKLPRIFYPTSIKPPRIFYLTRIKLPRMLYLDKTS